MSFKIKKQFRLPSHDYSGPGFYFVTVCTKWKFPHFGRVVDGKMHLSRIGKIARHFWLQIPHHFDGVMLDEFVIMPDHLHGIINIQTWLNEQTHGRHVALLRAYHDQLRIHEIMRADGQMGHDEKRAYFSNISPKTRSLSSIIRSYKSIVSKTVANEYPDAKFKWQPRYNDRIVRNDAALWATRQYIQNNPAKWHEPCKTE